MTYIDLDLLKRSNNTNNLLFSGVSSGEEQVSLFKVVFFSHYGSIKHTLYLL